MNIEGIVNVSGKKGLYKIISKGKNSVIVESLIDGKRMPIYSHTEANSLEEIGIYTYEDTVPLIDVLKNISVKENYKMCISYKSSKTELKNYFREILEDYDEDRVYISDIKKVFQWYNNLHSYGLVKLPVEKDKKTKKENA
tara:strand:+ start:110 stop:532 length:423 start_codon:yes stop_codon:yes gene_type:complete